MTYDPRVGYDPRGYAAQARELCPESDEYHERVWFCGTCRLLEQRLTPVSDVLADALRDAGLTLTYDWAAYRVAAVEPGAGDTLPEGDCGLSR